MNKNHLHVGYCLTWVLSLLILFDHWDDISSWLPTFWKHAIMATLVTVTGFVITSVVMGFFKK